MQHKPLPVETEDTAIREEDVQEAVTTNEINSTSQDSVIEIRGGNEGEALIDDVSIHDEIPEDTGFTPISIDARCSNTTTLTLFVPALIGALAGSTGMLCYIMFADDPDVNTALAASMPTMGAAGGLALGGIAKGLYSCATGASTITSSIFSLFSGSRQNTASAPAVTQDNGYAPIPTRQMV